MFSIAKEFSFEAGHRLVNHQGKCRNLHGHSYRVVVTLNRKKLDEMGMVADFSDLSPLKEWIDRYFDHAMILWDEDEITADFCISHGYKTFLMETNPTAENMAKFLFDLIKDEKDLVFYLPTRVAVESVTVWETSKCYATYSK